MNPFLSTPEATAFWREQQQTCEEARRLLVKTPEFAQFLAAGGTLAVVSDGFPATDCFVALLKDGDSIYGSMSFFILDGAAALCGWPAQITALTSWLTEARDGFTFQS